MNLSAKCVRSGPNVKFPREHATHTRQATIDRIGWWGPRAVSVSKKESRYFTQWSKKWDWISVASGAFDQRCWFYNPLCGYVCLLGPSTKSTQYKTHPSRARRPFWCEKVCALSFAARKRRIASNHSSRVFFGAGLSVKRRILIVRRKKRNQHNSRSESEHWNAGAKPIVKLSSTNVRYTAGGLMHVWSRARVCVCLWFSTSTSSKGTATQAHPSVKSECVKKCTRLLWSVCRWLAVNVARCLFYSTNDSRKSPVLTHKPLPFRHTHVHIRVRPLFRSPFALGLPRSHASTAARFQRWEDKALFTDRSGRGQREIHPASKQPNKKIVCVCVCVFVNFCCRLVVALWG